MDSKLRQEILNELKFLLNEEEEEAGEGFFSDDLDDIYQDIIDANKSGLQQVEGISQNISYLNLTLIGDDTDEGEIASVIKKAKTISDEKYVDSLKIRGDAYNILCTTNNSGVVLINRSGPNDTYYYIKCRKLGNKLIPDSARKIVDENNVEDFEQIYDKLKGAISPAPSPTPSGTPEADKFCADKADGTMVPDTVSGVMLKLVCKDKKAVDAGQQPTPAPAPVQQTGKFFRCSNKEDVAVFQQWLGVKEDCLIGPNTMAKAIEKGTKFNLQDIQDPEKQKSFCNSLKANRASYEKAITDSGQTVKGKCLGSGSGGGGKGGQKGLSGTMYTSVEDAMAYVNVKAFACAPEGKKAIEEEIKRLGIKPKGSEGELKSISTQTIDGLIKQKCQIVAKESKNYYDNKKLNEAKQLFNKLLKNL